MKQKVLILEDSENEALEIARAVRRKSIFPVHARTVKEAIRKLREEDISLAIMDIQLQANETCTQVLRYIKDARPRTKTIVVSQFPYMLDELEKFRDADEILSKPLEYAKLVRTVDSLLDDPERSSSKPDLTAPTEPAFDVGLSFAGADRNLAKVIADALLEHGLSVFYDDYHKSLLWGKNLDMYLPYIYSECCRLCVVLVSRAYLESEWTNTELQAALERARIQRGAEYILPVQLEKVALPGLSSGVAYVGSSTTTDEICEAILGKLRAMRGSKPIFRLTERLASLFRPDSVRKRRAPRPRDPSRT
jgi:ActR/RegA family two-component response regulator